MIYFCFRTISNVDPMENDDSQSIEDFQSQSESCDTPSTSSSYRNKRSKKSYFSKSYEEIAEERLELMKNLITQTTTNDMDLFFASISRTVQQFKPELQIEAREEFSKLLATMQRKNLEN